jgi:hypothetical protein
MHVQIKIIELCIYMSMALSSRGHLRTKGCQDKYNELVLIVLLLANLAQGEKEVLTDSAKWTALIGFEHYFG